MPEAITLVGPDLDVRPDRVLRLGSRGEVCFVDAQDLDLLDTPDSEHDPNSFPWFRPLPWGQPL